MTASSKTVHDACPEQIEYRAKVALPYTLMGGTLAMRGAGGDYLPQWPMESDSTYQARLDSAVLYPGFERAITSNTGRVFRSPIKLQKAPKKVEEWAKRVDKQGRDLNTFARDFFADALVAGIAHILTDHPPTLAPGATMEDYRKGGGGLPYFTHIQHRDVLDWEEQDGRLTMFRYLTCVRRRAIDNPYDVSYVEQVRILYPDRWEVYEAGGNGDDWANPTMQTGANTLGKIPLSTIYLARKGFMEAEPVFDECAYLNAAHWQSSSDQRNILHVARVPFLFGKGFKKGEEVMPLGAQAALLTVDPTSDLGWVEVTGTSIEQGDKDLANLQEAMRLAGLEPMMPSTGDVTATGRALDYSEAHSSLQAMAMALSSTIEQSVEHAGEWMNEAGESLVEIHHEFGFGARDTSDVQALITMRTAPEPQISQRRFWLELKRRNVLSDDFDGDQELRDLEDERSESMALREDEAASGDERKVAMAQKLAEVGGDPAAVAA